MRARNLFLALFLSAGLMPSLAHTHLVVNKDTSTEATFAFSDLQRINFVEGGLEFKSGESVEIPFSQIATIHFVTGSSDSVNDFALSKLSVVMDVARTSLQVKGYAENSPLDIYSVSGLLVKSVKDYHGEFIDISTLSGGTYILRSGDKAYKFVK